MQEREWSAGSVPKRQREQIPAQMKNGIRYRQRVWTLDNEFIQSHQIADVQNRAELRTSEPR